MERHYLVVIESTGTSFGAYVPDLPGCIAAGESREEVERLIREGIALHVELMVASGEAIPEPMSAGIKVAVAVPVTPATSANL